MEEQNHLVKLACVILFVSMVVCITMYNVCKLMDDREKQLQAVEADNATLRLEISSMSDAYQADMASMNDAIIELEEQINCVKEEINTEESTEEEENDDKSEADVPHYTLQNTETDEEVPPIIAAARRDDNDQDTYSEPSIIYETTEETYDKVIEVEEEELVEEQPSQPVVTGVREQHLTKSAGVFYGESGKETYYNLNMSGVIAIMRGMGYTEEEYPYWVRDDGVKMFGAYVMVAANLNVRPKGTIVETSLGTAIVVDTGGFAAYDSTALDIATSW